MAQKRMFSLSVVDTDNFLEMPISAQNLYFHLGMHADDDGFIDSWKKIMRSIGAKEDDLKVLIAKQYLIPFESGVIVIRHWRINNYLQRDRTKPTTYQSEMSQLSLNSNNTYNLDTNCIQSGNTDKNRLDKNRLDENRLDENIYIVEKSESIPYEEIIDYLNQKINAKYKYNSNKTKDCIKARWNEGFRLEDFKSVIDKKTIEWINTEMAKYLRPETLFGNKFESYLNQKPKKLTTKDIAQYIDFSDFKN